MILLPVGEPDGQLLHVARIALLPDDGLGVGGLVFFNPKLRRFSFLYKIKIKKNSRMSTRL